MRRRAFIALLGAATVWSGPGGAQPAGMPAIGLLSGTDREPRQIDAIRQGLAEFGFEEGRNVAIEYRWAEGQFDRLPALAADLVQRRVAVILAMQSPRAPLAAKAATATIPIVFSIGGNPVGLGLVPSLSRPGGNVTGATFMVNTLGAKRVELLHQLVPRASRIGLLVNANNPSARSETSDVQATAAALGLQVHVRTASSDAEIDDAFAALARERIDALAVAADALFNSRRSRLIALAERHALPAMYFIRDFADAGGLMSYGGSPDDAYRLAGAYAGRILKGEKPADLPVQQSTKVEFLINLKAARTLGLTIPVTLLGSADEVIE
ncbi:MAG TPA: ABC transporter substrate-binding protein [Microvirga sp.]|jgi:putative ABC transport system substrate-binding protein|nr:ABC transporter substrate-binding protein [Microvirga sp.]